MKICRKCKIEYKDDYIYCPKCGTPYDENAKPVRTPGEINGGFNIINKIWNGLLYGFGGILILAYITSFKEDIISSIFAILFGLSLFKIFYKIIEDKFPQIEIKYIKIARIVLPIILLFTWMTCTPVEETAIDNDNSETNIIEKESEIEKETTNNESTNNELNNQEEISEKVDEEPVQPTSEYEMAFIREMSDYDLYYMFDTDTKKLVYFGTNDTYIENGHYTGDFSSGITITWSHGEWEEKFINKDGNSSATLTDGNNFEWKYEKCEVSKAQKVLDSLK